MFLFPTLLEQPTLIPGDTRTFFLDAPGGCGKTHCERCLIDHVRGTGRIVIAVASSGIASLLLPGGTTAHSRFQLGLNTENLNMSRITVESDEAALLRAASLIVWDEAPSANRKLFEAVDRKLRDPPYPPPKLERGERAS